MKKLELLEHVDGRAWIRLRGKFVVNLPGGYSSIDKGLSLILRRVMFELNLTEREANVALTKTLLGFPNILFAHPQFVRPVI